MSFYGSGDTAGPESPASAMDTVQQTPARNIQK